MLSFPVEFSVPQGTGSPSALHLSFILGYKRDYNISLTFTAQNNQLGRIQATQYSLMSSVNVAERYFKAQLTIFLEQTVRKTQRDTKIKNKARQTRHEQNR